MRKIILMMSVSLDGYIAGPNGEIDWHRVDEEVHAHMNEQLSPMGMFLDGRITYQLMADFWPTADQDPAASKAIADFARIWRDMPKIVYSRTLQQADWNTIVVHEVIADDVLRLKETPGGDLAVGGANLAATFLRLELIDEVRLYVNPIAIGGGIPLFPVGEQIRLRLVDTRTFGNGVVLLRYERSD
ncbi:MAG: dihydrofolate reductase family protein [Nakamurella sp.]